jgi:SNF2 family DNA or RNA helicase
LILPNVLSHRLLKAVPIHIYLLTGVPDGDDDDVIFLSEKYQPLQEVCYGLIDVKVQAHKIPKPLKNAGLGGSQGSWPGMSCKLVRDPARDMIIKVIDPTGMEFGRLAQEIAKVLAPIMDSLGLSLRPQARLMMRKKNPADWPGQPCSEMMGMIINLYGPRKDAERVGRYLGQHNIWFRPPSMADKGIPVFNPHTQKNEAVANKKFSLTGNTHVTNDGRTQEEALSSVSRLFDSVASNAKAIPILDAPSTVTTKLLDHQRQALWWLLEREKPRTFGDEEADNSSLWRKERNDKGHLCYRDIVAGIETREEPAQVLGGLLADVMGLGKTIEILSLLASTKQEAQKFGEEKMVRKNADEANMVRNTKSTLLVSPLSAVKNWEDQTREHLEPGALSYYVYHGTNRTQNVYELSKYDIVITTYGTLAADYSKAASSVLHRLKWFRIVLDEAHTCREAKSMQAQAAYNVWATRKWALTGTPIQNRLDDLGSLTQFLKLFPYHTHQGFVQYIRSPASMPGNDTFLKSLRVFVDSFTLRRLKDRVDLPPRQDMICKLQFTESEKQLHDFFRSQFNWQMEEMAEKKRRRGKKRDKDNSGGYIRALQGILTLRLICAHGKELLNESNRALLQGRSKSEAIDIDDPTATPTFDEKTAYDNLAMMASADMDSCRECMKRIGGDSPTEDDESGNIRGYMLPCNDLICRDCFERDRKIFDEAFHGTLVDCPFCEMAIRPISIPITTQGLESSRLPPDDIKQEAQGDLKTTKFYGGPHTKTKALLQDLEIMCQDSQAYLEKGEPPLKCVIFSEFTSHLDLIERALADNNHTFVRIDGTMSLSRRRRVLDALSSDNSVTILLASIKAAGQGLNLTAASRAFIMEPMWNPAAEQQAVDRIYRLGQKREVFIKRYQMEESIEMKIMEIQRKKQALADISIEKNHEKLSKKETREQHMKDILSMFK